MPTAPTHVRDAGLVITAFGRWPSFHDAELQEVRRTDDGGLTLTLLAFEITPEVDARGFLVCSKHHLVRFHFDDVADCSLPSGDDTLMRLSIGEERDGEGRFLVELESVIGNEAEGFGGCFRAGAGTVVEVVATTSTPPAR